MRMSHALAVSLFAGGMLLTLVARTAAAPEPAVDPGRLELVPQTGHGLLVPAVAFTPEGRNLLPEHLRAALPGSATP